MKWIYGLLFAVIFFPANAQRVDLPVHHYIDLSVKAYNASTPAILLREISAPGQTDRQKVTSIFRWITGNISYNVKAAGRNKNSYLYEETDDDTGRIIKPLNLRVAETVIKRRMAVCDGYARLFKAMCDFADIPCEIVIGYARAGWGGRSSKFSSNHTWNAVYIDSTWQLLDATWASGYTNFRGDEFTSQYNERYFLAPPAQFISDHYPEDIRWALLQAPPVLNEFNYSPLRFIGFIKMGVHSFLPAKGIIEASIGDSIRFEAFTSVDQGLLEVVSGDRPIDTIWFDDEPVPMIGKKKSCTYKITEKTGDWLYVVCNGYVILRYKVNIRRPENKLASATTD
jgi:hypothetical protein